MGAIAGDNVIDVARACKYGNGKRVGSDAHRPCPSSMAAFLEAGDEVWERAKTAVQRIQDEQPVDAPCYPLQSVSLRTPVTQPGKIICTGLNYHDHCLEQNAPVPDRPIFFAKFTSALLDPERAITWPAGASSKVDYEAELAFVIRRKAYRVSEEEAGAFIAGYTILNDVSARDVQFAEGQWVRAKSFDTFCPVGPWLATQDEIADPHNLKIRCRVNDVLLQDSSTSEMIFRIPELLAALSATCTLLPGDIVSTGTPAGVGIFRKPRVLLKPGDVVEVEIDGLGVLRNPVK